MMDVDFTLLIKLDPIKGTIIRLIAQEPCTLDALYDRMKTLDPNTVSKPSLYRIVAELIEVNVLVRHKKTLLLNMFDLERLADDLEKTQAKHKQNLENFCDFNEQKTLKIEVGSLMEIDCVWSYLENLIHQADKPVWYEYNSRGYYFLSEKRYELEYYQKLSKAGILGYYALGGDAKLDQLACRELAENIPHWHFKACGDNPFDHQAYCVVSCAPYVAQLFIAPEIEHYYEELLKKYDTFDENVEKLFAQGLHKRGKCQVILQKNQSLSKKVQKKITTLFDK